MIKKINHADHNRRSINMIEIRRIKEADLPILWQVFSSAIHKVCINDYSPEQVNAWAPKKYNEDAWKARILDIDPFVAVYQGEIAGYADCQSSGYIDHFFVHASFQSRGVASRLMDQIIQKATVEGVSQLFSHVSETAKGFYCRYGFTVQKKQGVNMGGVWLHNYIMSKNLP